MRKLIKCNGCSPMSHKSPPVWGGDASDGLVDIFIDDKKYTYRVDAAKIPRWRKEFKHRPWRTLEAIKNDCYWWVDAKGGFHDCQQTQNASTSG